MKKSIPIKFTEDHSADELIDYVHSKGAFKPLDDNQIQQIAKNKWQGKIDLNPPKTHDSEERVISGTFDWKTIAIFILSTILLGALLGYNLQDRGMQEALDTIQRENKVIWSQNKIIDNAKISIAKSESKIANNKKTLKDKYNITVQ